MVGRTLVKGGPLPARTPEASLLPRLGRQGHIHGARFPKTADVRTNDLAAVIMFLSLRKAFQAEDFPRFPQPPYLPSPPALLSTVLQADQFFQEA